MQPSERVPPTEWTTGGAGFAVWKHLKQAGATARFVGGSARNLVMGLPVSDLDMATDATPERVIEIAEAAGFRAIPTGIEHGTVTIVVDHIPVEITTLRRDVETDGRRAVVAFTDDWVEDARRRDFTLNALYLDPDGTLYDPTGLGLADARAGRIRFVGDAEARIREDALRILRLFRFFASHGRVDPDPEGLAACARLSTLVDGLSGERLWHELRKLLAAAGATKALLGMTKAGVTEHLWQGPKDTALTIALIDIEAALGLEADPVLRLAALAAESQSEASDRLRLSTADRRRTAAATEAGQPIPPDEVGVRAAVYRLGAARFIDRLLITAARATNPDIQALSETLPLVKSWTPPKFPLSGADVAARGIEPGPRTGALLRAVEEWWITKDFAPDRAACLSALKEKIEEGT
jgi:poly(A) polymerase